jgi:hypothetical protein
MWIVCAQLFSDMVVYPYCDSMVPCDEQVTEGAHSVVFDLHSGHQVVPIGNDEEQSVGKDLLVCNVKVGQPVVGSCMEQLVCIAEDKLLVRNRL